LGRQFEVGNPQDEAVSTDCVRAWQLFDDRRRLGALHPVAERGSIVSEPALDPAPLLRVRSPADLVEVVPFLIGFHPAESLVLLGLNGQRERVGLTLRLDLPAARAAPGSVETCVAHLIRADARSAVAVVYDRPPAFWYDDGLPALPHADLIADVMDCLEVRDIALADALLVADGRWWSYLCANQRCCPAAGQVLRTPADASPIVAAATVAGMTAATDREALAGSIAPLPMSERLTLQAATRAHGKTAALEQDPMQRRTWAVDAWSAAVLSQRRVETEIDEDTTARLLVSLRDVQVRDACCGWANGSDAPAARAVARQLARRACTPWDVTPYALFAWFCWRAGEGALARIAVEHALASDPSCTFARLIEELLDRGVNPKTWRDPPLMGGVGGPRLSRRRGG
jgi:hypothetical protein